MYKEHWKGACIKVMRDLSGPSTALLPQSSNEFHRFFTLTENISTAVRDNFSEEQRLKQQPPTRELRSKPDVNKKRVGDKSRTYEMKETSILCMQME